MPDLVLSAVSSGVIGQALKDGRWKLETVNPREFTQDVHHTVDDRVFGGSDGMLMLAEPLAQSIEKVRAMAPDTRVVHLSPRGRKFTDAVAREWAAEGRSLTLVASRYAGVDQRFIDEFCDDEISIGDFVVSGGDLPAALVIDAVLRHRPGVLGNQASAENDSFSQGILESRQYTRPREWRGAGVPSVLTCGDPQLVSDWQFLEGLHATLQRRPDLVEEFDSAQAENVRRRIDEISARINREDRIWRGSAPKGQESKVTPKSQAVQEIAALLVETLRILKSVTKDLPSWR